MTNVLLPLANGVEEIEAVIVVDVLRRANWDVTLAGVTGEVITASRGIKLCADCHYADVTPGQFDILVFPGGANAADTLAADNRILQATRNFVQSGKLVAAICAGPLVLQSAGVLEGRRVTSHPSVSHKLHNVKWQDSPTVVDGNIVTSQGPGTAFEFALLLLRLAGEKDVAQTVADAMIIR